MGACELDCSVEAGASGAQTRLVDTECLGPEVVAGRPGRLGGREVECEGLLGKAPDPHRPEMRVQQQSRRLRGCHALNRGPMGGNWEQQQRVTMKLLALGFLKSR